MINFFGRAFCNFARFATLIASLGITFLSFSKDICALTNFTDDVPLSIDMSNYFLIDSETYGQASCGVLEHW